MSVAVKRTVHEMPAISQLSRASIDDIVLIERVSDRPMWSERLFLQEFANPNSHAFGARLDGQLVGFILFHCIADEAHILKFGMMPEHRGKGFGRHLITYVLRDMHANAAKWVTLEVRYSNQIAIALYRSLGFTEVGTRERYYSDNGENALIMNLNIARFIEDHGDHPDLAEDESGVRRAFHLF